MKEEKKQSLKQPHDTTFKKLFGRTDIASDVIANHLPKDMINHLDLSTLKQIDGSFISESLEGSFSDLMFQVTLEGEEAYVALLLEHKSYPDKLTAFQVAKYMIDFWSKLTENGAKELPLIVPIVVYHGKGPWNYATDIRHLIKNYETLPSAFKERMPVLKHDFINFQAQEEKDINTYEPMTRMVVRSFKYIFHDVDQLMESFLISLDEVSKRATDEDIQHLVDLLLLYFSNASREFEEEALMNKIHDLDGKGEQIMTILQERERRGKERGLEKGLEQGKKAVVKNSLRENLPYQTISKITGLTIEKVKEIEKEMTQN